MEYQKITNLLGNVLHESPKFIIKSWVEINDDARETYNTKSPLKFKTTMLKLGLCSYSDP